MDQIAITGISGRFPGCSNMQELKQGLLDGVDLVTDNHTRWPHESMGLPSRMGIVPDLERFDSGFFGMNPKQADTNDPRIRKMLEVVFEAIVDAGMNPSELRGTKTGVFLAISPAFNSMSETTGGIGILSRSTAIMANTISFSFDFKGPSYSLDTGCSSSLYAVAQAMDAINHGTCDIAVVCGAQTHLDPSDSIEFSAMGVINPEGKCKTFDQNRNGYVKSDGIVAVLLQKTSESRRIYATIAGAGANVDGYKSDGLIHPSNVTQRAMLEDVYARFGIDPNDVGYFEAHGTGTLVGDVEETQAIVDFFFKNRPNPLLIGSVKSNLGHSENAAGLVSLAKVLVAVHSGVIPGNLHFDKPAMDIPGIADGRLKVINKNTPLPEGLIAINSFGFGGANAHAVLRPYTRRNPLSPSPSHRLVYVSGRTEEALHCLLNEVQTTNQELLSLFDHVFPVANHNHRGYAILRNDNDSNKQETAKIICGKKPQVWFIFSGMGSQWPGMGKDFMQIDIFRSTMEKCAEALKPYDVDLMEIVTNGGKGAFDNLINCFTAITAMSVSLCNVLFAMGIEPDKIIGHSLGEIGCAYADGLVTAEQAVLMSYGRGFATLTTTLDRGLMASIGLSAEECLQRLPEDIHIAANNSPDNVTVSGPEHSVETFLEQLTKEGIFNKIVASGNVAFHCKFVHPAGRKLLKFLEENTPAKKPRSEKWLPTAISDEEYGSDLGKYHSPQYQYHNFMNAVQFRQVLDKIPQDAILVEVAPRGLLQAIFRRNLNPGVTRLSLACPRTEDNLEYFLENVGKFFLAGGQADLKKFYERVEFPVSVDTPSVSSLIKWNHQIKWAIPRYNPCLQFGERVVIDRAEQDYLDGHVVDGKIMFPGTGYFVLAWKAFAKMLSRRHTQLPVVLENVKILRATILPKNESAVLTVNIFKNTGQFEISCETHCVASGKIRTPSSISSEFLDYSSLSKRDEYKLKMDTDDFYKELHLRGYDYYGIFRGVQEYDINGRCSILKWHGNWVTFLDTVMHHIVMQEQIGLFVPTKIEKVTIDPLAQPESEEIRLDYNAHLNSAKCGGAEIRKIHGVNIKRRNIEIEPTLQEYKFVPESTADQLVDALAISIQIVIENTFNSHLNIVQFQETVTLSMLPKTSKATIRTLDKLDEPCDLLLTTDLERASHDSILSYIKNSCFIFTRTAQYDQSFYNLFELEAVYKHATKSETLALLRRTKSLPEEFRVVQANSANFNWIEDLKAALGTYTNPDSRIYLVNEDYDSGIVGFFNCVKKEHSLIKSCNLRVVLVRNGLEPFSVRSKFYASQLRKDLTVNIFYDHSWGTYRLLPCPPLDRVVSNEACLLNVVTGKDKGLQWVQKSPFSRASYGEPNIDVHYASINDWDHYSISGKIGRNIEDVKLGLEYSGVDKNSGNKVMGLLPNGGALATSVHGSPELVWNLPSTWSLEDGATVPLAYTLAIYALEIQTKIESNNSILIHHGNTDIGMALTALSLNQGCMVYILVDDVYTKACIKKTHPKLFENNIFLYSSQYDGIIMKHSKGKGVDLVLNCENDNDIKTSTKCLGKNPKFFQFGYVPEDAALLPSNCSCINVTVDNISERADDLSSIFENLLRIGVVKPLPRVVYDKQSVEDAFREENPEKVLVMVKEKRSFFFKADNSILSLGRVYFDPEKSYVIVGGLGGLGLELANWLIQRGARKLVLNSRRQVASGYQAYCLEKWIRSGIVVVVDVSDTTTMDGAENLIKYGSNIGNIGGIFNVALVLKDELIVNQTVENFNNVIAPKLFATQNLDLLSRKLKSLEHFVVFSSMVSSLGNATQSNYGYANSAIERLCESRKADGLRALAVQWGPVGDVGFVARLKTNVKFLGAVPQSIASCLNVLDRFLQQDAICVTSCVYSDEDEDVSGGSKKTLAEAVAGIFGVKNVALLDDTMTLLNLGMDSLLGFEIKHMLAKEYDIDLSINEIRNTSIGDLKQMDKH